MISVSVDHSISAVLEELEISKPTLYGWMRNLGITPYKINGEGNTSYVGGEDLTRLRQHQIEPNTQAAPEPAGLVFQADYTTQVGAMASAIASAMVPVIAGLQPSESPARATLTDLQIVEARNRILLQWAENEIRPSSKDLKAVLGSLPGGDRFLFSGFKFSKEKEGRFVRWEVSK